MSIISEQPLPITILLLSRVSTYAHCVESIAATFIFWVCPGLCPGMPPRQLLKARGPQTLCRTISIHSLASSNSTLVEVAQGLTTDSNSEDQTNPAKRNKVGNAFIKFSTPILSRSHTVGPFARRMSLPARRLSESFATAMATPFRTHMQDVQVEPSSYFSPIPFTCEPSPLSTVNPIDQDLQTIEMEISIQEVACVVEVEASPRCRRVSKVKHVTGKMKSLLRFGHRSTVPLSS